MLTLLLTRRGGQAPPCLHHHHYDKERDMAEEPSELLMSESVIAFLGTLALSLRQVERERPREGYEALFLRHLNNLSKAPPKKLSPQARIDFGRILASFHEICEMPHVANFPDEPKMM